MRKLIYIILLLGDVLPSFFSCGRPYSNSDWIRMANEQVGKNTDSLKALLNQVKRPLGLHGEDRLLYGWLSGYVHAKKGTSMVEDSLLIPLADSYIENKDTTRKLLSYWMKARYTSWLEKHDEAFALYDEGFQKASELKDTFWMQEMLMEQGRMYRFVWQDYPKCTDIFRRIVAIKEKPVEVYSLGLAMALEKNDSAVYWMNHAAELSMQEKDTAQAVFFLRNLLETQVHALNTHRDAIQTAQRLIRENERLHLNDKVLVLACYESIVESYLKLGELDAAQHSLNLADSMAQIVDSKSPVTKNMLSLYQTLIDYTRNRHFDLNDMLQYNVLLYEKLGEERKNIRQFKNSNEQLTADALEMIVEQQRTQISLLVVLLVAFALVLGIIIVVNFYRRKLRRSREQINGFILIQQKNERIIRHNEQMIADLQTQIADGQEAQEQLEESKAALVGLQRQTEVLRDENANLQHRIEKYKHQPSEEEIEKWKANANRMYQLEERERELTAELANNNELMRKLREKPKFLGASEWKKLEDITNRIYNRFTERIKSQYPHLTEVDIQLCILLKLRFTVS